MNQENIVAVNGLTKVFKNTVAVAGISFVIPKAKTYGLLGGNGAGKTTTIAMLLGMITPTSGGIHLFGQDIQKDRFTALGKMNFSSPYVELPRRLTVKQNLTVFGKLYNVPDLKTRLEEIAEDLHLKQIWQKATGDLSAGQKTRVTLAKALLNKPDLLLLDEPTASLDPDTADWVRGYFEKYQQTRQATILLASHNMGEVERLCDHVYMMKEGKIVDQGAPADLISRYGRETLEEVFLAIARGENMDEEAA